MLFSLAQLFVQIIISSICMSSHASVELTRVSKGPTDINHFWNFFVTPGKIVIGREHAESFTKERKNIDEGVLTILVIHPHTGDIMLMHDFQTSQPGGATSAYQLLSQIEHSRILVLLHQGQSLYLRDKKLLNLLEKLGAKLFMNLAYNECWVFVAYSGNTQASSSLVIFEAVSQNYNNSSCILSTQFSFSARQDYECDWHREESRKSQREFCQKYAGYKELCECSPLDPRSFRYHSASIPMRETIPIAIITAVKPHHFYRLLKNLLEVPGAEQTPIYVYVDGMNQEIISLAKLFGLHVRVHRVHGKRGTTTPTNMHIKFSLWSIFQERRDISKAIILEDDLLLSPDFISFFHQTSSLLDDDDTILAINAFNMNSVFSIAQNASVLMRVVGYPQCGWMMTRKRAKEAISFWIGEKEEVSDWDLWLSIERSRQGMHIVLPEISRTFHAGEGGAHVTGFQQSQYFDFMDYNKNPNVKLQNLDRIHQGKYDQILWNEIEQSEIVGKDFDPCSSDRLSQKQGSSFKAYVHVKDTEKLHDSPGLKLISQCFHGFPSDKQTTYKGTIRYNIKGQYLYIIGCPRSIFCKPGQNISFLIPSEDALIEAEEYDRMYRSIQSRRSYFTRKPARTNEEEFALENFDIRKISL